MDSNGTTFFSNNNVCLFVCNTNFISDFHKNNVSTMPKDILAIEMHLDTVGYIGAHWNTLG